PDRPVGARRARGRETGRAAPQRVVVREDKAHAGLAPGGPARRRYRPDGRLVQEPRERFALNARAMYRVHLQEFEGPLDLLLYFIRRDELDVFDIPIARIADEYLAYVRLMEAVDLDSMGDFLYMAAVLINI